MKKIIAISVVILLAPWIVQGQGAIYLSNLGQTPSTPMGIGNNSWMAAGIYTGTNAGGYLLDFVQLSMADEYSDGGSPSGFTVQLYTSGAGGGHFPGNSLSTLGGSADPSTAGIYVYTPPSNLVLSPNTFYSIVLTAGTPFISPQPGRSDVAPTGYLWNSLTSGNPYDYNPSSGWFSPYTFSSTDGLNWTTAPGVFSQFSITAEPAPEPGVFGLSILGSLPFIRYRLRHKYTS